MLEISQRANDQFLAQAAESFDVTCDRFVSEHFPELYAMSSPEMIQETTDKAVVAAERIGVLRTPDTLRFVYLWYLLGQDFDVNPQYRWLASILNDRQLDPNTRMVRAIELVAQRMEAEQPLTDSSTPVDVSVAQAAMRANAL